MNPKHNNNNNYNIIVSFIVFMGCVYLLTLHKSHTSVKTANLTTKPCPHTVHFQSLPPKNFQIIIELNQIQWMLRKVGKNLINDHK